MATLNPYLFFDGNTEEAFNFYKAAFGTEFDTFQRFGESPMADSTPDDEKTLVMHVSLPIGNGITMMGNDRTKSQGPPNEAGNNVHISINAESEEEGRKLWNALTEGATVTMPFEKTFWGALFGMFTDKFGIHWMINYDIPGEKPE